MSVFRSREGHEARTRPSVSLGDALPRRKRWFRETIARKKLSSSSLSESGGVWTHLQTFLSPNSDKKNLDKLEHYLHDFYAAGNVNNFFPLFSKVQVSSQKDRAKNLLTAYICSTDQNDEYCYGVVYTDFVTHPQDVQKGKVKFNKAIVASLVSKNRIAPRSYKHAMTYDDAQLWDKAFYKEMESMVENQVATPCDKSDVDGELLQAFFVNRYKEDDTRAEELLERKSRLVANGNLQSTTEKTYSPGGSLKTIRIVISLVNIFNLTLDHADVTTAFLNSPYKGNTYIRLPEGFSFEGKRFAKLNKSIYGLKNAPRDWFEFQNEFIINYDKNIKASKIDPCLYFYIFMNIFVIILVYVDDYLCAYNSEGKQWFDNFLKAFQQKCKVKYLGVASHVLQMGIHFDNERHTVTMTNAKYLNILRENFNLVDFKPIYNPPTTYPDLNLEKSASNLPYRELLGALLWLSRTVRPDITFFVNLLSRYSTCYTEQHFKQLKQVLRYVLTTADVNLQYRTARPLKTDAPLLIEIYVDSDWAGDRADYKSYSGVCVFVNKHLVNWLSKKQDTQSLSSAEAEYMAITEAVKEALQTFFLLSELVNIQLPMILYVDNKAAIDLSSNYSNNARTKHIDIRYHFCRYWIIESGLFQIKYVASKDNVADLFTKPLSGHEFQRLVRLIMTRST